MVDDFRSTLLPKACRSKILADSTLPVYVRRGCEPGSPCFWWEQRYWLQAADIADQRGFRKTESRRNVLTNMELAWDLQRCDHDILRDDDARRHLPLLLSTRALLVWCTERWLMSRRKEANPNTDSRRWLKLIIAMFDGVDSGLLTMPTWPVITIAGVRLQCANDGTIDLGPLLAAWAGLGDDWGAIVARSGTVLRGLAPVDRVPLRDVWLFVAIRLHITASPVPATHPLRSLQTAMLHILTFIVEVHCHHQVIAHDAAFAGRPIAVTELHGPSGRWRVHHRPTARISLLAQLHAGMGSDNAISTALTGNHGVAAQVRSVRNKLYLERSRLWFQDCAKLSIGWDGSTHGGRDVNVGYAVNLTTGRACCLQPKVVSW